MNSFAWTDFRNPVHYSIRYISYISVCVCVLCIVLNKIFYNYLANERGIIFRSLLFENGNEMREGNKIDMEDVVRENRTWWQSKIRRYNISVLIFKNNFFFRYEKLIYIKLGGFLRIKWRFMAIKSAHDSVCIDDKLHLISGLVLNKLGRLWHLCHWIVLYRRQCVHWHLIGMHLVFHYTVEALGVFRNIYFVIFYFCREIRLIW